MPSTAFVFIGTSNPEPGAPGLLASLLRLRTSTRNFHDSQIADSEIRYSVPNQVSS